MKRKLINFLKKAYARLLRFDFIWKRRAKVRRLVRKIRRRNLRKYKKNVMARFQNLTLAETGFQEITLEPSKNENVLFGYDVLGQMINLENCDYIEYCSNLGGILDNEDIERYVTCAKALA